MFELPDVGFLLSQLRSGLTTAMIMFLIASGLSLIFGVLGVINFAHGAFYMLGAYFAFSAYAVTGSFALAIAAGAVGVAVFGMAFERHDPAVDHTWRLRFGTLHVDAGGRRPARWDAAVGVKDRDWVTAADLVPVYSRDVGPVHREVAGRDRLELYFLAFRIY